MKQPDEMEVAWSQRKLVIVATIAEGPHAGETLICITERKTMRETIADARTREIDLDSLTSAIRNTVMLSGDPGADAMQNLMDDLAILLAEKYVGNVKEADLKAAGLFHIALSINPDERPPWSKRGFLDQASAMRNEYTVLR